jgi:dCTP deaminase
VVLADHEIKELCRSSNLIHPFAGEKTGNPSYGLSSFGYDLTLGATFVEFLDHCELVDPTKPEDLTTDTLEFTAREFFIIEPKKFVLAHTNETISMPNDLIAQICDKSTLARCGIDVKNTVIEPGFVGQITLEITNNNNVPVKLYTNRGIAQILFFRGQPCLNPYGKDSKYQYQKGVTLPK